MRRNAWWLFIPVALGFPAVLSVLAGPGRTIAAVLALAPVVAAILAGLVWNRPEQRRGWLFVVVAACCLSVGNTIYALSAEAGDVELGSWLLSLPYLVSYLPLGAGVHLLARHGVGRDRGDLVDALIVATSGALLAWSLVLAPLATGNDVRGGTVAYAVAFPAADLLVLGLALRLVFSSGVRNTSRVLLVVGLTALSLADIAFSANMLEGAHVLGSWSDVLWLVAYALVGAAALHPSAAADDHAYDDAGTRMPPWRIVLVGASLLAAPVTLAAQAAEGDHRAPVVEAVCAAVIALLVMWRLVTAVRRAEHQADRLETLSRTDPLTGALNRRALDDRLHAEVERSRRTGQPLSVALLDLDHFKHYNDTAGHLAGDRFLRGAVAAWGAELRASDVLARYGGEEFAVILADCGDTMSREVVERVRAATPPAGTCSAGVATWDGIEDVDELVDRVDIALYAAKRGGRNRTVVAGEPVATR